MALVGHAEKMHVFRQLFLVVGNHFLGIPSHIHDIVAWTGFNREHHAFGSVGLYIGRRGRVFPNDTSHILEPDHIAHRVCVDDLFLQIPFGDKGSGDMHRSHQLAVFHLAASRGEALGEQTGGQSGHPHAVTRQLGLVQINRDLLLLGTVAAELANGFYVPQTCLQLIQVLLQLAIGFIL